MSAGALHEMILHTMTRLFPELLGTFFHGEPKTVPLDSVQHTVSAFRPDAVFAVDGPDGDTKASVAVLEIQMSWDANKVFAWQVYIGLLQHRYRCPVHIYVVAPELKTEAKFRAALEETQLNIAPFVTIIGQDRIPRVTDPIKARENPLEALLSALFYGYGMPETPPDPEVLNAFFATLVDEEWMERCYPVLEFLIGKNEATQMKMNVADYTAEDWPGWEVFLRTKREEGKLEGKLEGIKEGKLEGIKEGIKEGKLEGIKEGRQEGRQEGRLEMLARSVRKALAARGLALGPTEEALLAQAELDTLEAYFDRALNAQTLADVFGPG